MKESLINSVAGATSAMIVMSAFYPIDYVRTQMQVQVRTEGEKPQFKNGIECFRYIHT